MHDRICPFLTMRDSKWTACYNISCGIWDSERGCCSFNTKPLHINKYEQATVSRIKDRLKVEVLHLLEGKTGWGRVELKSALFDLIDGLKDESSL